MRHTIARAAAALVIAQMLYACASTPAPEKRGSLVPACRANEVLYCADNGSRATDGICTCQSQSAAKAVVDSL